MMSNLPAWVVIWLEGIKPVRVGSCQAGPGRWLRKASSWGGKKKKKDKRPQHVCVSKEVKAGHDIIRLLFRCCCKQCLRFHEAFSTCVVKNIALERQSVKKTSSNEWINTLFWKVKIKKTLYAHFEVVLLSWSKIETNLRNKTLTQRASSSRERSASLRVPRCFHNNRGNRGYKSNYDLSVRT